MPESLASRAAASIRLGGRDALDVVLRRREPKVPPRRMWPAGEGDYVASGQAYLGLLINLGKLRPDERVLEIGSGAGWIARPLSDYLGPGATYDGLDADERAVEWCRHAYRHRPDFEFQRFDSSTGPLPFGDGTLDVVVMISVLTHMQPAAAEHHLREARRVLAPEGRLFATLYLLDDAARSAVADGTAAIGFGPSDGRHAVAPAQDDARSPIAYDEEWFIDRAAEAGFKTAGIRHGTWTPREAGRAYPDIVVARL